jgi:hypothetical protein
MNRYSILAAVRTFDLHYSALEKFLSSKMILLPFKEIF